MNVPGIRHNGQPPLWSGLAPVSVTIYLDLLWVSLVSLQLGAVTKYRKERGEVWVRGGGEDTSSGRQMI